MAVRSLSIAALVACTTLLCACATNRMSEVEKLSLYRSHAGEPLRSIRYTDPISWEKVDDQHLLLTLRPREAYLLGIDGPCLDWGGASPAIGISSQAGVVSARFDRISVPDVPGGCRIREIRRVDIGAVREARQQRDADMAAGSA